jgi:hypothetical protein
MWAASENMMLMRLWPATEASMTIALAQEQALRQDPLRAYRLHRRLVDAIAGAPDEDIEPVLIAHIVDAAETVIAANTPPNIPASSVASAAGDRSGRSMPRL